jgi:hypothetical protein
VYIASVVLCKENSDGRKDRPAFPKNCYFYAFQKGRLSSKIVKIKIYRTVVLPVLHGSGSWSLTLHEEKCGGSVAK